MRRANELPLIAAIVVTCLATAYVLHALQHATRIAPHDVLAFGIPFGAVVTGLVAASGFPLLGKRLGVKPTPGILVVTISPAVGMFFLIRWWNFSADLAAGNLPPHITDLAGYLDAEFRATSVYTEHNLPVPLGVWGYGIAAWRIVGCAVGGLLAFGLLYVTAYCDACGMYFRRLRAVERYLAVDDSPERFEALVVAIRTGDPGAVLSAYREFGGTRRPAGRYRHARCTLQVCPGCDRKHVGLFGHTVEHKRQRGVPELAFRGYFRAAEVPDLTLPAPPPPA